MRRGGDQTAAVATAALLLGLACTQPPGPPDPPPPPPPPTPSPPPPANAAPIAHIGGPYDVEGRRVTLDARASSDPDGDALSFRWRFADGDSAAGALVEREFAGYGTDTVRLVVTDARGAADTATAPITRREPPVYLSGAGNIASCSGSWDQRTAELLDTLPGYVFTAGDNAFPDGSAADFACFHASWGRHLHRMLPALGNHEYQTGSAAAAFDYFGDRAGPRDLGYYSRDVGAWHVIVLNDNTDYVPWSEGSSQLAWLRADLAASTARCTLVLWHAPRFLSSRESGFTETWRSRPIWDVLYAAGVDVVVNGHQHHYERMAPLRPDGTRDDDRGIRQFNVGTGGGFGLVEPNVIHPHSEARAAVYGVLRFALRSDGYAWTFVPAAGQAFDERGTGTCH